MIIAAAILLACSGTEIAHNASNDRVFEIDGPVAISGPLHWSVERRSQEFVLTGPF